MEQLGVGVVRRGVRVGSQGLISLCAACLAVIVQAQGVPGGKVSFIDLRGREFKDAQVLRVEPGVLVLMTDSGVSRVPANSLPEDIRKQYQVTNVTPEPVVAPPPAAPLDPASADEAKLRSLEPKIAKLKSEVESLENGRATVKAEYDTMYKARKAEYEAAERAEQMEAFKKRRPREEAPPKDPDE